MGRFGFMHRSGRVKSSSDEGEQNPSHDPRRLNLLIVDENECARKALARRLTYMGYDVQLADNGMTALTMLAAQRFDAILVDCEMKLISASDTISRICVSGTRSRAALLSVAARGDVGAEKEALHAGADEHVAKPFDFDVLDIRVRHAVRHAHQLEDMRRHNEALDARVARRAIELGEVRAELEEMKADRGRLISSIRCLHEELERLGGTAPAGGANRV